jgi:hypothetical protein
MPTCREILPSGSVPAQTSRGLAGRSRQRDAMNVGGLDYVQAATLDGRPYTASGRDVRNGDL